VGVHVSATSVADGQRVGFSHEVALYDGVADLVRVVLPFIREGIELGEPVLVALLPERLALLEQALGDDATRVDFVDMAELGGNPARIIPEWRRFLADTAGSGPVRGVGEPIWSDRRAPELDEAELHEALLNVAFDDGPGWRLLCPYDVSSLPEEVVAEAIRNHPVVHADRNTEVRYGGHDHALDRFATPLAPPPSDATSVDFGERDLAGVRSVVARVCEQVALGGDRADDIVLAAHELATNSILHGGGHGSLTVWQEPDALVVEIRDSGRIDDPLVGRGTVDLTSEHGRGIWMANQLCDLVQVRSTGGGTQVRLYAWL
jgi:anti-sigma regulatory factor (Ser/Thr protein kinase)